MMKHLTKNNASPSLLRIAYSEKFWYFSLNHKVLRFTYHVQKCLHSSCGRRLCASCRARVAATAWLVAIC